MKIRLGCCMFLFWAQTSFAGWVDDWFNNATIDGSSSYNNQQRGFYSAGGFRGRINTANDYLLTASLPRLKSGCGGVDLFLGGVSFLDEDYLVQKFQNMIQAAPAVAFDVALKVMSKELSDTMTKLEAATSWLNNLQLNDCAMTKRVVAEVQKDDPEVLSAVWSEMTSDVSLRDAINKNYQQTKEDIRAANGSPPINLKDEIQDCPADFRAIFAGGSLVANAAGRVGMAAYADIARGYLGDVEIRNGANDPIPLAVEVAPCAGNDALSLDDFLYGNALAKNDLANGGNCYQDNARSVINIVQTQLTSISNRLQNRQPLSAAEIAFIENSPVPIYAILHKSIAMDNVAMTITLMSEMVATAYTYRILDDLYRNTDYAFRKVETLVSQPGVDGAAGGNRCNVNLYAQAIERFKKLKSQVGRYRTQAQTAYQSSIKEHLTHLQFASEHAREEKNLRQRDANDIQSR